MIFASGSGSNFANICHYFKQNKAIDIAALFTNKPDCEAVNHAKTHSVKVSSFDKESFETGNVLKELADINPDLIVLAGFLLKIPDEMVSAFPNKIINIHPALLPKYGGKGMYGKRVHEAVLENKEKESGITIHYVNEHYDEGNIIAQFKVELDENDTPDTIEQKVRALEMKHYPETIQQLLL